MDGSGVRYRAPYGAKKDQTNWAIFIENFLGTSSLIITFFIFLATQNRNCFHVYSFNSDYSCCTELNDALLYGGDIFWGATENIFLEATHFIWSAPRVQLDPQLSTLLLYIFLIMNIIICTHVKYLHFLFSDCFSVKLTQSVFNLIT